MVVVVAVRLTVEAQLYLDQQSQHRRELIYSRSTFRGTTDCLEFRLRGTCQSPGAICDQCWPNTNAKPRVHPTQPKKHLAKRPTWSRTSCKEALTLDERVATLPLPSALRHLPSALHEFCCSSVSSPPTLVRLYNASPPTGQSHHHHPRPAFTNILHPLFHLFKP